MSHACTNAPRYKENDYIIMEVKGITYGDENHVAILEFSNISSEACEFGYFSSPYPEGRMLLIEGFALFQGNNCIAHAGCDRKLFKISPKQKITVEVLLQADNKKISSAAKRIRYTFTHMRVGESTSPQYSHFELSAAIKSTSN